MNGKIPTLNKRTYLAPTEIESQFCTKDGEFGEKEILSRNARENAEDLHTCQMLIEQSRSIHEHHDRSQRNVSCYGALTTSDLKGGSQCSIMPQADWLTTARTEGL